MLTLKQAFSTAAALQSAKTQIKLCEACPMHSLHKLCERIEGTLECGLGTRRVCFGMLTCWGPHRHWIVLCFTVSKNRKGISLAPSNPTELSAASACLTFCLSRSLFFWRQIHTRGLHFPQLLRPVMYVHSGNEQTFAEWMRGKRTSDCSILPFLPSLTWGCILKVEHCSETCLVFQGSWKS